MRLKIALLGTVATLSLIAAQESSARHEGWYIGLEAGANWIDDTSFDNSFEYYDYYYGSFFGEANFDTGWAAFGTVGYAFDSNWRIEGELGFRQNDMDIVFGGKYYSIIEEETVFGLPSSTRSGELTEYTVMLNVIYDVPLTDKVDLNLGLGAGVDFSQFDDGFVDDDDATFAYQAIVGVTYAISKRLDLSLTYRYLHVDEPSFSTSVAYQTESYQFEDLEKHTVTVGLRYDLYEDEAPVVAAPPAPPPAPALEPSRQFIVFFGFNKANLTAEAMGVIKEAAAAAKSQGSASLVVVGHTDTVGSSKYNDALSLRRSGAVKAGLISEGIAAGNISASGKGESELMVQTGDNSKEPQNRRATIDLN